MRLQRSFAGFVVAMTCAVLVASAVPGRGLAQTEPPIPAGAVGLEGTPSVRVDASEDQVTRRQMTEAESAENRLRIRVENGRYFWTSRGDVPLTLTSSGEFMYLSSPEVGKYVRFQRVNDRVTYLEHVDMERGTVTYWGEVSIVLGK
jgi:hypothetical protein